MGISKDYEMIKANDIKRLLPDLLAFINGDPVSVFYVGEGTGDKFAPLKRTFEREGKIHQEFTIDLKNGYSFDMDSIRDRKVLVTDYKFDIDNAKKTLSAYREVAEHAKGYRYLAVRKERLKLYNPVDINFLIDHL